MIYYAHTATKADGSPEPDRSKWQPLDEHLGHVAAEAAHFAAAFDAADWGRCTGLWHDFGKYLEDLQRPTAVPQHLVLISGSLSVRAAYAYANDQGSLPADPQ